MKDIVQMVKNTVMECTNGLVVSVTDAGCHGHDRNRRKLTKKNDYLICFAKAMFTKEIMRMANNMVMASTDGSMVSVADHGRDRNYRQYTLSN